MVNFYDDVIMLYFDTCCYGRQWDSPDDPLMTIESLAIASIIENARLSGYGIWGSMVVAYELGNIPSDHPYRMDIIAFYTETVNEAIVLSDEDHARAIAIQAKGIGKLDSQHVAAAEAIGAKYLITTDKKFVRKMDKKNLSTIEVVNPLTYIAGGMR